MSSASISILESKEWLYGLDIIRILAVFFVIAGHFFLVNTSLLQTSPSGVSLFIQGMMAQLFMIAVPLFVMLTGYLNGEKTISRSYFKKLFRVLISYLVFSILSELVRVYFLKESFSLMVFARSVLDFSIFPYAWYIEMWIGLFLLTPFLNILYKNIGEKKNKIIFISVLLLITTIPHWLNRNGMHFWPGFWAQAWPLSFFFAGSYIKEYQPRINGWYWLVILCFCMLNPLLNLLFRTDHFTLFCGGPEDVLSFIISILFFILVYRQNTSHTKGLLRYVSGLVLDIYMGCWMFDAIFYPFFKDRYYESQSQFGIEFCVLIPILVFISSFALAAIKDIASRLLMKAYNRS